MLYLIQFITAWNTCSSDLTFSSSMEMMVYQLGRGQEQEFLVFHHLLVVVLRETCLRSSAGLCRRVCRRRPGCPQAVRGSQAVSVKLTTHILYLCQLQGRLRRRVWTLFSSTTMLEV